MKKNLALLLLLFSTLFVQAQTKDSTTKAPEVFTPVDVFAEFPGGIEKFYSFMIKNLRKPAGDVRGSVLVTFVVEKDGSLTDIKVAKGLSETADAEAIRLIKSSPKWKPAMQNNTPVKQRYTLPINFN